MFIFLDIDGVMVPAKSWKKPELSQDGFYVFSEKAINVLNTIVSKDTTVMLTTSHKSRFNSDEWKSIFERRGINILSLKSIQESSLGVSRKDEILNWFNQNSIKDEFIILDDDKSLNDLPPNLKRNLVLTSSTIGLNESHLPEIKSILFNNKVC